MTSKAVRRSALYVALLCSVATAQVGQAEMTPGLVRVKDLDFGYALFAFYQDDYFSSIVRLMVADEKERLAMQGDEAQWLLGGLYLAYGLDRQAEAIAARLDELRLRGDQKDRFWFFMGQVRYRKGRLDAASEALQHIGGDLPLALEESRKLLQGQIHLARKEYSHAAELLRRVNRTAELVPYARYNLGIALLQAGDTRKGIATLEEVAESLRGIDETQLALRDKAHFAIGTALLKAERAEPAAEHLRKVRLTGPYANPSLLRLGWADIALGQPQKALVPWLELQSRDINEPVVQEAILAVPHALDRLGAWEQALEFYQRAIPLLDARLERLDTAIENPPPLGQLAVLPNPLLGTEESLTPANAEAKYLFSLLTGNAFHQAILQYRDLHAALGNLERRWSDLEVFRDYVTARRSLYLANLGRLNRLSPKLEQAGLMSRLAALRAEAAGDDGAFEKLQEAAPLIEATAETGRRLLRYRQEAAIDFNEFIRRIDDLEQRLKSLLAEMREALNAQERHLQQLAAQELRSHRRRIAAQIAKARFAAAQLYDRALHVRDEAQEE